MAGEKRKWRTVGIAAAVLASMLTSLVYGYLIRRNHYFPYHLAIRTIKAFQPEPSERWHFARPDTAAGPGSPENIKHLANLPYLQGYRPATSSGGVRSYDRSLAQDGLNLFVSAHAPVATLMDMDGTVVKTWTSDTAKAFPGFELRGPNTVHAHFFRRVRLMPDGGVLAIFDEIGLVRLDSASRIVWALRERVHHDFFVDEKGEIWVLTRESKMVPDLRPKSPVWEDAVVEVSPDGHVVRRISLLDAFRQSSYDSMLIRMPPAEDIFHTNSIQVLDGTLADRLPAFRKGNILVSIPRLDAVAVLDPAEGRIVWALTGQWSAQHSAHLLANGNLLLFDNLGLMKAASRVVEVEPLTQRVVWSFGGRSGEELLSETSGWVERLSNGNTLITESNFGRVIEVTPDNRVAWEFVNPNRAGEKNQLVATIYGTERVGRKLPFLGTSAGSSSARSH
ncbi:MAG TPA: arylsulfotransferase family protein [Thermoanaerobaculia bacterium]